MAHPESSRPQVIDVYAPEETISNQDGIWALGPLCLVVPGRDIPLPRAQIKIQYLSLLIGSGSDRQHGHWLFSFHILATLPGPSSKSAYLVRSTIGCPDWGPEGWGFGDSLSATKWFYLGTLLLQLLDPPVMLSFDWIIVLSGSVYNPWSWLRSSGIKVPSSLQSSVW